MSVRCGLQDQVHRNVLGEAAPPLGTYVLPCAMKCPNSQRNDGSVQSMSHHGVRSISGGWGASGSSVGLTVQFAVITSLPSFHSQSEAVAQVGSAKILPRCPSRATEPRRDRRERRAWSPVTTSPGWPCPVTTTVSRRPRSHVAVTGRHRFRCVSTRSPTSTASMGVQPSRVRMSCPPATH